MLDREFATRFLAFYLSTPKDYVPDLDSFLNNAMAKLSTIKESERYEIKSAFLKGMKTAYKIFGNWAFRKADKYPERRKPISKALFEVWSVVLAKMSDANRSKLITNKDKVKELFANLCKNGSDFWGSITSGTGDKNRVLLRFTKIQQLIAEVIDDK